MRTSKARLCSEKALLVGFAVAAASPPVVAAAVPVPPAVAAAIPIASRWVQ